MKKILVGYDGSEPARSAILDLGCSGIVGPVEAVVLSVADVWMPPRGGLSKTARAMVAQAESLSVEGANLLKGILPDWRIEAEAVADSPAWGLIRKAETWKADLVVIGAHGQPLFDRYLFGSVAAEVLTEVPCPVRVSRRKPLRNDGRAGLRLIVAVDGSDDSARAYEEILTRTWPSGTEFRVVTVVDPKLGDALRGERFAELAHKHFTGLAEGISGLAIELAGKLRKCGHAAESVILEGHVKSQIIQAASEWDADCIFIGARGLQTDPRRRLGTVASAAARRAHCTVEVTRARAKSKRERKKL